MEKVEERKGDRYGQGTAGLGHRHQGGASAERMPCSRMRG